MKTAALHPPQPEETQDGVQDTLTPLQVDHPDGPHQLLCPQQGIQAAQHATRAEVEERYVRYRSIPVLPTSLGASFTSFYSCSCWV